MHLAIRTRKKIDDDDIGETIDPSSLAGGGHGGRSTNITKHELRVSHAVRSFLVKHDVLSPSDVEAEETTPAIQELLDKPHVIVPPALTDRSKPLAEYFISSSHNTYLLAHQLYGKADVSAYKRALSTGSRCVEIDAWDNADNAEEPKVTHGYTLTSNIPFRSVCETIRDVVDEEAAERGSDDRGYGPAPVVLSLENHCDAHGQLRLVEIMREVFGDRLLSKAIRDKGTEEQENDGDPVTLADLGSKIVLIVEYYFPKTDAATEAPIEYDSSDDDEAEYQEMKKAAAAATPSGASIIIPELADLGVYAQSVKPRDDSWFDGVTGLKDAPHDQLINVSETGLSSKLPAKATPIARHNAQHLMRVFPKGTRIDSGNLDVIPFWAVGAHICALNWQTFGAPMQLNEALFSNTDGFVLKPAALRAGGSLDTPRPKRRLRLHVGGATDVPAPEERKEDGLRPYLTCTLVHAARDEKDEGQVKRKTHHYKHHKLTGALHRHENPPNADPMWDQELEWEYDDDELVFLRLLIKSDDSFARNPIYAVAAVRLLYVTQGWSFIRMLDLKGRETHCTLLVKFVIEDV